MVIAASAGAVAIVGAAVLANRGDDTSSPDTIGAVATVSPSITDVGTTVDSRSSGDLIDLTGVDGCSLLDQATVQELTGESIRFVTQPSSDPRCFWGASRPIPPYVEIMLGRSDGSNLYGPQQGCQGDPVDGIGTRAEGGTCASGSQTKVYLTVFERGVVVMLVVNEPSRPLAPSDLAPVIESVLEQLTTG